MDKVQEALKKLIEFVSNKPHAKKDHIGIDVVNAAET